MSMANFHKVEEKLGKQAVQLLLDSARNGDISDDQMDSIADLLGRQPGPGEPNDVFGRHRQRMERDRDKDWHVMLKYILCDWWQYDLFELTNEKALEKIVKVCQDSRCLAPDKEKVSAASLSVYLLHQTHLSCWRLTIPLLQLELKQCDNCLESLIFFLA